MADKYPNRIKGMTDQEIEDNQSRKPKMIDNDFHPEDRGLNASQDDHWGTQLYDMIQKDHSRSVDADK